MPKIVQATGTGTASNIASADDMVAAGAGAGADLAVTITGAPCAFASGTVRSGWVFAILTAGAAAGAGSGRILMRAVSFFGPACMAEPG